MSVAVAIAIAMAIAIALTATATARPAPPPYPLTGPATTTFGRSVQGRRLLVTRIGPADAVTDVLVIGIVHGDERAGAAIAQRLRRASLAPGVRLWLVPTANPDGASRGTRHNARGVDLNRNFPHRWLRAGRAWDTYFPGPRASSEPETRAVEQLVARIRPDVTVWYHQHLDLVVRPRVGWPLTAARRYAAVAHMRLRSLAPLRGTAIGWQGQQQPTSAPLVVELPAGVLTPQRVLRHVAAVQALERLAAARAGT